MANGRGRPYEFEDPNDRSVNKPHVYVERAEILGLYNQAHPTDPATNLSDTVRTWFEEEARRLGWSEITFVGNGAVLAAAVRLDTSGRTGS